jgi:hypothetical protein
MRSHPLDRAELALAILFVGIFAGVTWSAWESFFWLHALTTSAALLFPTYLILVLMLRRYREAGKDGRSLPDDL